MELFSLPLVWPEAELLTHASIGDSWTLTGKSYSVFCGDTALLSWLLVHARFCLCSPRICFPSPVKVLQSNPTGALSQISWGFSVPLPDPQVGKSVVGPRAFLTVWDFFSIIVLQFVCHLLFGFMLGNVVWPRSAAAWALVPTAGHC